MSKIINSIPLIGENFISWHVNGRQLTIEKSNARFEAVKRALRERDFERARNLFDIESQIKTVTSGNVTIKDGVVRYKDTPVHGSISKKIVEFINEELPVEPLLKFLNNLYENTDERVREVLFDFIEVNGLTITMDGGFIAYKLTTRDGKPYYNDNGKYVYKENETYSMPKTSCLANVNSECGSVGFYAGARAYWPSKTFSDGVYTGDGKMFVVKIFPQDVISVPKNAKKICISKFTIIEIYASDKVEKPIYNYVKAEQPVQPVQPTTQESVESVEGDSYVELKDSDIIQSSDQIFVDKEVVPQWRAPWGSLGMTVAEAKRKFQRALPFKFRRKVREVPSAKVRNYSGQFVKGNKMFTTQKRGSNGRFSK